MFLLARQHRLEGKNCTRLSELETNMELKSGEVCSKINIVISIVISSSFSGPEVNINSMLKSRAQGPGRAGAMVSCSPSGRAICVRCLVPATKDDSGDHCTQVTKERRQQSTVVDPGFPIGGAQTSDVYTFWQKCMQK